MPKIEPFPFQKKNIAQINTFNGRALLGDQMGLGKALTNDTRVLTPDGWVPISQLQPSDHVIDSNGRATRVQGVYPQGKLNVYRLTFRDGSTALCCKEHLWLIRRVGEAQYRLKTTEDLLKAPLRSKSNWCFFLPMLSAPVEFYPAHDRPVDPYVLGYLLGNGGSMRRVVVSIPDQETVARLNERLPAGHMLSKHKGDNIEHSIIREANRGSKNTLPEVWYALRNLELLGKYSHEKHIPQAYLRAPIPERIELLQGLMDADGSCCNNHLEYSSSSHQLAIDVQELVECLGGCCRMQVRRAPQYTHNGEVRHDRDHYRLSIKLPKSVSPFKLERKSEKYDPSKWSSPNRSLVAIEAAGIAECTCIKVTAPDGLFVIEHGILTHNTNSALWWMEQCENTAWPAIIVCPANVKDVWNYRAWEVLSQRVLVLHGRTTYDLTKTNHQIFVLNYDILKDWVARLRCLKPQTIVLDECHLLQNPTTQRTKAARALCRHVKHVLALSGTPITNRPIEFWPTLNILHPLTFKSQWAFGMRYCGAKKGPFGWEFKGATNIPELHSRLKELCLIRHLKKDVLKELPEKIRQVVPLALTADKAAEYHLAQTDFITWLKKQGPGKAANATKAQRLVQIGYLLRLAARLKLRAIIQWIRHFFNEAEPDEKLVLFAIHRKMIESIERRCGVKHVSIHGGTPKQQRKQHIDQFKHDRKTRLFIGNVQAAGVGIDGLQVASTAVFVELGWRPGDLTQAEDRLHRIGQKDTTWIYYLVAAKTIETRLCAILQKKQEITSRILDGTVVDTDLDVYSQLEKSLKSKRS